MNNPLKDQLNEWKQKNMPVKKKKRHKKKKKQEKLSEYDLKELMGINRAHIRATRVRSDENR